MHIHLTRNSHILALFETGGKKSWGEISIEELVAGLESMKGMADVVVYCSADDPDVFVVDPPQRSREIVELIHGHKLPFKFLNKPIAPLDEATLSNDPSVKQIKPEVHDASFVLRLSVLAGGTLLIDGRAATLSELDAALESHAAKKGTVWYYRENPTQEPAFHTVEPMELIAKHRLPVRMSSEADFSDAIDAEGGSWPRR